MPTTPQRTNFERTSALLNEARALLTALYHLELAAPLRERLDANAQAVPELIMMLEDKFEEIAKARDWEWTGLGGVTGNLSDDEVREAAGELADQVLQRRAENDAMRNKQHSWATD